MHQGHYHQPSGIIQFDKETLAIILVVMIFHQYLLCRNFVILLDHKLLSYLFASDKPIVPMASVRIQRWLLLLSDYSYCNCHRPGKAHVKADTLSHLPVHLGTQRQKVSLCSSGQSPVKAVLVNYSKKTRPL